MESFYTTSITPNRQVCIDSGTRMGHGGWRPQHCGGTTAAPMETWNRAWHEALQFAINITKEIRDEVATLKDWPKHKGTYVKELEELNLPQYRQLLAGQNRIIVERSENEICYIHLVCHTSRDLEAMLRRRLLST